MRFLFEGLAQCGVYYSLILVVRVLLTWFPTIDWYSQPYRFLAEVTDPYLNIFRRVIPPIQMGASYMDISPIIGIGVLNYILVPMVSSLGHAL